MFAHNLTTKSRRNAKIARKIVRATAYIPHHFQGQNVTRSKVTRLLWVALPVTTCRGRGLDYSAGGGERVVIRNSESNSHIRRTL